MNFNIKKVLYSLFVFGVIINFTSCGNKWFLERSTGIEFPRGMETIEERDNYEWVSISVYRLRQEDIEDFIENNDFSKLNLEDTDDLGFNGDFLIQPENRDYSREPNHLYSSGGAGEDIGWYCLLDSKRGKLWCEVEYPDMAGDGPND